jgi:hypothetical protein
MLASLPKLADRNFIIGFLVPTLLISFAFFGLFSDVDDVHAAFSLLAGEKKWEDLTVFVFAVWLAAVLLMLVNHLFYRIVEGYVGPFAWLGPAGAAARRAQLSKDRLELIESEKDPKRPDFERKTISRKIDDIDLILMNNFPPEQFPTLPTRFGNVIRAFEFYSYVVYGADPIPIWTRLTGVMSKQFAAEIADAKAEVDFFLNICVLSALLTFFALERLLLSILQIDWLCLSKCSEPRWMFLGFACGFSVLARLAYEGAVWRAIGWGTLVKSAFDLYLPTLARQLGYELPKTKEERRSFWETISLMNSYFQPMDPAKYISASAASETPEAEATPEDKKEEQENDREKEQTDDEDGPSRANDDDHRTKGR